MAYDQTNRILAIKTTLGDNQAVLTELDGEDAISRPYVFRIRFATESSPGEVKALLGTPVTLWMGRPGESDGGPTGIDRTPVHGRFRRLTRGIATRGEATEWQAEVVPLVWFLSRTSDCRIFQEKTIPEIIEEILGLHGVSDYQMKLTGSYDPLEYCVQYRESALDFICRLMEQAGIYWWHEHTDSAHTLVIADENGSAPLAPFPDLPISGSTKIAAIHRLDEEYAVRSGKWTLRDYNFETPSLDLEENAPTTIDVEQMASRERYDYPGLYKDSGAGRHVADLRMEEEEAHFQRRHGQSGLAGFHAGLRVKIDGIEDPEVLLTEVRHRAEDYSHWSGEMWGGREPRAPFYENGFVCIPKKTPYRAERVTPKPFVRGPQTAVVTGPGGEEIHTDEYGRVKVQFHWDRVNPADDSSSCWVRVSQGWAGSGWGQMHIPRIGHEVIVDFLEGDPDRPIITGRVYNAENTVPYALPANKTQSGIKSNSSKGGGGSNEFRFEDKKGSEQVFFHAEKDLDSEVENNETRKVGGKGTGDRTTEIKNNETLTVGGNRTTTVQGNFDETIKGTETRNVTGNVSETFMANEDRKVIGSQTENVIGSVKQSIIGSYEQTVMGGITVTTPASINVTAVAGVTFTAPGGFTVIAPGGTRTVDLFFKMIGGEQFETFMTSNNITMTKFESNLGLAVSVQGVKMETVHLKMEYVDAQLVNTPMEFADYKAHIKNAATAITKAALKIFT